MTILPFFDVKLTDILALMLNVLTFIFAFKIYKNFDVKKAHINKQLDTVLSLIQDINANMIPICFNTKTPKHLVDNLPLELRENAKTAKDIWYLSLFHIAVFSISYREKIEHQDVYLSNEIKHVLPFITYINNPLLPPTIAKKLCKFYSPVINYRSFEDASQKYVEVSSGTEKNTYNFQYPDLIDTYKSWGNFVASANELKTEIENWLDKYGSKDINFNLYLQNPHLY